MFVCLFVCLFKVGISTNKLIRLLKDLEVLHEREEKKRKKSI